MAATSILAVDWSGARQGVRKKLWLAEGRGGSLVRVEAGRDRDELVSHLIRCAERTSELVVGLDFAFSLPAWFLRELGISTAPELWERVARCGEDWLAACTPPFWGPRGTRRPPNDPARPLFRRTESERLPVGGIQPKSPFQIAGAGSVGTGSLRGMPHLRTLRAHGFSIWPFEPPRFPLALEIYPRLLTGPLRKSSVSSRRLYLETHLAREPRRLLDLAASSEDAFDAAVSAVCMARHAEAFARLGADAEPVYRLEGRIWSPVEDPTFPGPRGSGPPGAGDPT